jgi:hypothetical protein
LSNENLLYFCIGDLFNNICGYRGYYTDQSLIHFDDNRLHTESKENNRKLRKQADRVVQQDADNNDESNYTNNTLDDTIESNPGDQLTSQNNDTATDTDGRIHDSTTTSDSSTDSGDKTNPSPDATTSQDTEQNNEASDEEYGYYNPNDRRKWNEKE